MKNTILARFEDSTALLEPNRMKMFEAYTELASEQLALVEAEASNDNNFWFASDDWRSQYRPYKVSNGILYVPVRGVLVNNMPWQFGAWATGYEYIRKAVERGLADSDVKGIMLNIESGGGMVSGNWDLVEFLVEARDKKPMRAVANDYAYSAAYNIGAAAGAGNFMVSRTGGVGSIGVLITHFEYSKMLKKTGITVNIIRSKPGKAEGNGWEALSEDARKHLQSDVDELHEQFVNMVATNRSMDAKAVDSTNARTFMGKNAIEAGLADSIGNIDDAITAFEATIQQGDEPMADFTQAQYDAAVATARDEGHAEGHKTGLAEGQKTANERINTILGSDEGKARPKAALNAAIKTSMSAEEAVGFLADLDPEVKTAVEEKPAAGAGAPKGMLEAALEKTGKSKIDANLESETGDEEDEDVKATSKASAALDSVFGARKK